MDGPHLWDAINEMNKQGIIIGTLLGGFTMSFAFNAFSRPWENNFHRNSSIAAFVSSVCFICVVCISALVVFSFSDYEYFYKQAIDNNYPIKDLTSTGFFLNLSVLNMVVGIIGMLSLFFMFSVLGWEKAES